MSEFNLRHDDCLIVCAGFEDRATGVIERVSPDSKSEVLIVDYLPFVVENRLEALIGHCEQHNLRHTLLAYDRQSPAGFGATLLSRLERVRGTVYLDVSAMSRLLIVQSICALAERQRGFTDCVVLYAEAKDYPPSDSDVEKYLKKALENSIQDALLLSSGVFDICIVPELSSSAIASTQSRLVAFPTFSSEQLTALLNELGPSRLTLVEGDPPGEHNRWRTDAIRKINGVGSIAHQSVVTSTLDYRKTLEALLELYAQHSDRERIIISPTGSKMQTVAVGLFRAVIKDVQIVYPTPKSFCFPAKYTKGVGATYMLSLSAFSSISDLDAHAMTSDSLNEANEWSHDHREN